MKLGRRDPRSLRPLLSGLALSLLLVASTTPARAQERETVGVAAGVNGQVEVCDAAGDCREVEKGTIIYADDTIRTGDGAKDRIRIRLDDRFCSPGACPSIVNMSSDTELGIEGYVASDTDDADLSIWEIVTGSIRATFKGFTSRRSSMQVRTGTTVCGSRSTTYIVSYDPDSGISIVAVEEGLVVCETRAGEYGVGAMEKLIVGPDDIGRVTGLSAQEWAERLASVGGRHESGSVEFVGEARQVDRANDPDSKKCKGNVPIRVAVSWSPERTAVEITYQRLNIMGLPRGFGSGDTTQYLECLEGGRQVSHRGAFDPTSGAVDALDERGTPPDLVDVSVDWNLAAGVVTSVSGSLKASDLFNGWELDFALEGPCSGGGSLAEFTAANTPEDVDARALYTPPVRPESGVIIRGCRLDLVSPPDGPLELSFGDLPEWAQDQLVTVGAMADCQDSPSRVIDGDPLVLVDGLPVARLGDPIDGGASITAGSATILVNGQPAAVAPEC